jgi:hypothetical protein
MRDHNLLVITPDEPSHIHIPRPSRVRHLHAEGTSPRRDVVSLEEQVDTYRDPSRSFAFDGLELAGAPK